MGDSQPDHDQVLQDLLRWLASPEVNCEEAGEGNVDNARTFVPFPSLADFFNKPRRVQRLLEALFSQRDPADLPDCDTIRSEYLKIFSILLLIGRGQFIKHVVLYDLGDRYLPFLNQPRNFPVSTGYPNFWDLFHRQQWRFCAPELRPQSDRYFDKDYILPIIQKQRIGSGGNAIVYKIAVHEAYNKLVSETDPQTVIDFQ